MPCTQTDRVIVIRSVCLFVPGVLHTYLNYRDRQGYRNQVCLSCLFLACSITYLKYRDRKGYRNQVCLLILIWIAEIVWLDVCI